MNEINLLNFKLKKFFLAITLISLLFLTVLIFNLKTKLTFKVFLILLNFIFFVSFLTIFEPDNSLKTNLVFWLIPSLIFGYFYILYGLIIFIFAFLRLVLKSNLINSSVKVPFYQLISQDFQFLTLTLFLIFSLFLYQKLSYLEKIPISFEKYSKIFNFLNEKVDFNQYFKTFFESELKNKGFVNKKETEEELNLLQEEMKKNIYNFLNQLWQSKKTFLILAFIFFLYSIFYPLASFLIPVFSLITLMLVYIYKTLGLFKINYRDIKKEFIEI